ncbi:MAG TPA: fatty acyl-AMP ligase, partial [Allosphingosinicella sp.]|nr:fatty acyl-AMP ligase [Allosphingosinicella sp.]
TIMPPGEGIVVELVEETTLSGDGKMHRDRPQRYRAIVNCGRPARDMEIEIRDEDGATLGNCEIGKDHWPQDIEWAVEQLPGFKAGDIAAFSITTPGGEETPAVLVQCRTSDAGERTRLREIIRERVRAITGMNCVIELVPPRTLPRTSSGKLSRAKARSLYLTGEIQPYDIAA